MNRNGVEIKMKKITSLILLVILLTSTMILSSCSVADYINGVLNNNYNDNNSLEVLSNDSDLVLALIDYLHLRDADVQISDVTAENKINKIKKGHQNLLVDFKSSSCYFVCGYYNNQHKTESDIFCCANKYTWVKYEDESFIKENYGENKLIIAFQINKASFIVDILSNGETNCVMEHCQTFAPQFINGKNVKAPDVFDESFIYINSSDKTNLYHFTPFYINRLITFPTIYLDGKYYLTTELYVKYADGKCFEPGLADFGKYENDWKSIILTDKYSVSTEEKTIYYGLVDVNDFVKNIIDLEE
jgi:hypothetical protein